MNDNNFNDLTPENDPAYEALKRADKIRAIKNSVRDSIPDSVSESVDFTESADAAADNANSTAASGSDEWENEIADRIANRVKQMKEKKSSGSNNTDKLIEEIDSILADQDSETAEENAPAVESEAVKEEIPAEIAEIQTENAIGVSAKDVIEAEYAGNTGSQEAFCENETAPAEKAVPFTEEEKHPVPETEKPVSGTVLPAEKKKPKKSKSKKKKKQKKTVGQCLLGLLPQKKDRIGERIRKIVFLGSVAAIIVCGYIVSDYYIGNYLTKNRYDDIMNMYNTYTPKNPSDDDPVVDDLGPMYELLPGAQKLLDINKEIVGVISIPGTEVNYPIVQSDDLEKYLHLDVMGKEAKAGAIFLDYRCNLDKVGEDGRLAAPNTDNLIVYGHNMANRMMFGSLRDYKEYDYYYGEHPIIQLNSNYQTYTYKIFAFFIVDANDQTDTAFDCWNNINFMGEEDFYNYVNEAKRRTLRLNDIDVQYGDKLLTLSTCNSIFGNGGSGRLIILARQVRDGEDPYEGTQDSTANPNIKWPNLYYTYKGTSNKYDPDAEFVPYGPSDEKSSGTEE